jgi:hypothetical protein
MFHNRGALRTFATEVTIVLDRVGRPTPPFDSYAPADAFRGSSNPLALALLVIISKSQKNLVGRLRALKNISIRHPTETERRRSGHFTPVRRSKWVFPIEISLA